MSHRDLVNGFAGGGARARAMPARCLISLAWLTLFVSLLLRPALASSASSPAGCPTSAQAWSTTLSTHKIQLSKGKFDDLCFILPDQPGIVPTQEITTLDLYMALKNAKGAIVPVHNKIIVGTSGTNVDFSHQNFDAQLQIYNSLIATNLDFDGSRLDSLDIEDSVVLQPINAENLQLEQYLNLQSIYAASLIDLTGVKAGSYAAVYNLLWDQDAPMLESLEIGGNMYLLGWLGAQNGHSKLDLDGSDFKARVFLRGVRMPGWLDCRSCTIADDLQFSQADSNAPTKLSPGCAADPWKATLPVQSSDAIYCDPVDFSGSHIGGDISFSHSWLLSFLSFDRASAQNIDLEPGTNIHQLLMRDAALAGSFSTDPEKKIALQEVQLNDSTIARQLDLGGLDGPSWSAVAPGGGKLADAPLLDLTDVSVDSFTDCLGSYPTHLVLDGFRYEDFVRSDSETDLTDSTGCSGSARELDNTDLDRPEDGTKGWMTWLGRGEFEISAHDRAFNPQPYLSLASLLSEKGFTSDGNYIAWSAKWYETCDQLGRFEFSGLGLLLLGIFAGFGIGGYFLAIAAIWVGVSLVIGFCMLKLRGSTAHLDASWCFRAAASHLLPVGNLGKEYEDFFNGETNRHYGGKPNITLDGLQAGFFMGYAAWGWVLAALIAAALTSAIGGK